jgi:hypothetical protein
MNQLANFVEKKSSLPWHGWLLGCIFFLYGLASAFDYVMSMFQGEAYYRASGMTDFQVAYFSSIPAWAIVGWTLSVWGGLFGSLALLLRHRFAAFFFIASLLGSLMYVLHTLVLSAGKEAMGGLWFMPFFISGITVVMIFYSGYFRKK